MRNASTALKVQGKVDQEEVKINASALFPHDCVRTMKNGDIDIANAQFDALPNYMEGENGTQRIMVICDSSGSMVSTLAGSIQAIDVSTSLSLYCSDRMPKDSPFYRKFIQFESESKLSDWNGMKFSDAYGYGNNRRGKIFNGACGSTNIERALDSILAVAKNFNATNEQIPNVILIVSDMQFDSGVILSSSTVVESCLDEWEKADIPDLKLYTGMLQDMQDHLRQHYRRMLEWYLDSLLRSLSQSLVVKILHKGHHASCNR